MPFTLAQVVLRFRMAIYFYWAMSAAFLGYWVLYFENQEVSPSSIGWMMSLYTSAALFGQYTFGYLSDKMRGIRILVVAAGLLYSLAVVTFPLQTDLIWLYPRMALVGFLQQPIGPMLDSWTLKHLSQHQQEELFGRIRGFGSLGWATVALLTAYLVTSVSWNMMFLVATVAGLLLSLIAWTIPDAIEEPIRRGIADGGAEDSHKKSSRARNDASSIDSHLSQSDSRPLTLYRAVRHLFGNAAYVYVLAVVFLMYLGVQTTFNFQGLLIKNIGGGTMELGWTFFVGVMSEIPAMFLSVWLLARMPPRKMMVMAGCLYMVRYGLIIYFQTSTIIMLTAALEGIAFGLMLTSLRNYIFTVVATDVQTSALTVVDATFLSLTVIVGGVVGGFLIEQFSVIVMLSACMTSSAVALMLLFCGQRFDRHHYQSSTAAN